MNEPTFVREARGEDHSAIDALLVAAFSGNAEARLVRQLRADGDLYLEQVMPFQDGVAGYLALSRFKSPEGWLALAPVAIHPDWQNQGRGTFMVQAVVDEQVGKLKKVIVVLGDGKFYRRCGFLQVRASRLISPYPKEHMLLAGPGMDVPELALEYPPAFARLD